MIISGKWIEASDTIDEYITICSNRSQFHKAVTEMQPILTVTRGLLLAYNIICTLKLILFVYI